jgi:hypothetical protein
MPFTKFRISSRQKKICMERSSLNVIKAAFDKEPKL